MSARQRNPVNKGHNVSIQFLTADDDANFVEATVILRPEMVIDIPDQDSSGPYLVRGNKVEHFFAGRDSLISSEPVDVVARWVLVGDSYVGVWIEEGVDYLFSFKKPRG